MVTTFTAMDKSLRALLKPEEFAEPALTCRKRKRQFTKSGHTESSAAGATGKSKSGSHRCQTGELTNMRASILEFIHAGCTEFFARL
eukprot:5603482-Amphidinium_carterae.3